MPQAPIDILARLVAFDTTSRLSNLALIEWVSDYLAGLGVSSHLTFSDAGDKANLFARVGPVDGPALVLSGHTDVVPVDGQSWDTDPFELSVRDGRAYGRGAADMKGFIACVLAWMPGLVEQARAGRLCRPVGIALSYDEEVGCLGVGRLIEDLARRGESVSGCVIGEPTGMRPVIAHKGIAHYRCVVTGREAHSSLTPQGVNAIEFAARLITHIRKLADAEAQFGHRHALYDVPFATLQTGVIRGGVAGNIVPKSCEFIFECRWLPGDRHERFIDSVREYAGVLEREMRQVSGAASILFEPLVNCPPFEAVNGSEVLHYACELGGCRESEGAAVAYTTEAGRFSEAGIPCVVFGPGHIREAHRPDEFIELEQLDACMNWLEKLGHCLVDGKIRDDTFA
ncbi:acetylornithine deacetylase [Paludibacterium paludis]|uniref:Acetylornithine deacetylase n=1 Tax=Paludibacterium paludis TaxID=1225769 RepID=A0A918P6D5_9NEIS|nr:acetylornithine deacetylase [Paludibacterium paludis]GGY25744.1 acetylornithine deacetylase [Paludibacterium paludis]